MKRFRLWPLIIIGVVAWAGSLAYATMSSPLFGAAWDDLRFPATTIRLGSTNPPAQLVGWKNDGGTSDGLFVLEFEDAIEANEEQVWFVGQMPHRWREASAIDVHVHWQLEDTTSCNVRWCVEYAVASDNAAWDANTTIDCADCPAPEADKPLLCDVEAIAMTGEVISALTSARLYRNSSHANDTCNSKDAWLHTADIHYQVDRPGSRQELTK